MTMLIQLPHSLELRPMQTVDIPAVLTIEQVAKPNPWTAELFRRELDNDLATATVLLANRQAAGYMISWLVAGEIQIHTIVTAVTWRGRGFGHLLLANCLADGISKGAIMATLEVRENNIVAQNLYHKYGFQEVGRRPRYYKNNENAVIMTAEPFDQQFYARLKQQASSVEARISNSDFTSS